MDTSVSVLTQIDSNTNSTNPSLSWDDLTQAERRIVISVVYEGTPEEARKQLCMAHSTFYRKWGRLKVYYNDMLKDFPKRAGEILVSQSIKAAQELGKELNSDNEKIRHQAATQVLDRTLSKEPLETNYKRQITFTEWISLPEKSNLSDNP